MKTYYFGCYQKLGHYLMDGDLQRVPTDQVNRVTPWHVNKLDGKLCPMHPHQVEGLARLSYRGGFTALAFWDRSVDRRPGSCSVFIAEGDHYFSDMVELFKKTYPEVFNRLSFEIVKARRLPGEPLNLNPMSLASIKEFFQK